jgi:hypothetical protein
VDEANGAVAVGALQRKGAALDLDEGEAMNTRSNTRAALAALALSTAAAAFAQAPAGGRAVPDAASGGMPPIQQQGGVSYVSGGVGSDEASALKEAQHDWPLALRFTGRGTEYLADVHVRIVSADAGEVLDTDSRGPYMLVRLRPGRYAVHATYNGNDQRKAVTIPDHGATRLDFYWDSL